MARLSNNRQNRSAARVLLICPACGQENSVRADTLRTMPSYACGGDGCSYDFDLAGTRRGASEGLAEAMRRFHAAVDALRGEGPDSA